MLDLGVEVEGVGGLGAGGEGREEESEGEERCAVSGLLEQAVSPLELRSAAGPTKIDYLLRGSCADGESEDMSLVEIVRRRTINFARRA